MTAAEAGNRAVWVERLGFIVFAIALGVGGFVAGLASNGSPPSESTIIPIELPPGSRYVALGDSYSAGEGLEPFLAGTQNASRGGDRCHRSTQWAYPLLVTFANRTLFRIGEDFRACSGAIAANVFETVQEHDGAPDKQGLQVEQGVLADDVGLVTITMGGNDLRFADVLFRCGNVSTCMDDPFDGTETLAKWVDDHVATLKEDLTKVYAEIRSAAPNARVVTIGYPALFPETAPRTFNTLCQTLLQVWDRSERDAIRETGLRLNSVVKGAAQEAGVEYVDPFIYFVQHEPCGPGGEWVRFVGTEGPRDGWFHPNRTGQAMLARILACHMSIPRELQGSEVYDLRMSDCVADRYPNSVYGTPVSPLPTPP